MTGSSSLDICAFLSGVGVGVDGCKSSERKPAGMTFVNRFECSIFSASYDATKVNGK